MNYQPEIQLEEVQSSKFSVQRVYTNLRTANDRQGCPDPGCPGKLLPFGEPERGHLRFSLGSVSPQNLIAYGKSFRKMNLTDPKKEQKKRVPSFVFRDQSKYTYRAFFSMPFAPCPLLLALLLHPAQLKRSKMKNLITKQFKTNT